MYGNCAGFLSASGVVSVNAGDAYSLTNSANVLCSSWGNVTTIWIASENCAKKDSAAKQDSTRKGGANASANQPLAQPAAGRLQLFSRRACAKGQSS